MTITTGDRPTDTRHAVSMTDPAGDPQAPTNGGQALSAGSIALLSQIMEPDSLASRLERRGDRPFRDEDDIVRGASNFINDLAMLAATTDASVLKDLTDLGDLIKRRASEAAMILTSPTPEAEKLRQGLPPVSWSDVAVEYGQAKQTVRERFTPGVSAAKTARRQARNPR